MADTKSQTKNHKEHQADKCSNKSLHLTKYDRVVDVCRRYRQEDCGPKSALVKKHESLPKKLKQKGLGHGSSS
jgi:hypothetical protein